MKVFQGIDSVPADHRGVVLTIGNFDGVHRGHQQLLAQCGLYAAQTGGPVTVLTFDPHPMAVLAPERVPPRLAPPAERLHLLRGAGAECVVLARTDRSLLGQEPEAFVENVIRRRLGPTHIVEGPTFRFGRGRRGDPALLRELAAAFQCHVHVVPPVTLEFEDGETLTVSSSLVRKFLLQGDVRRAAMCLGRPYAILGRVGRGDQRGRTLGFPTANLVDIGQLTPGDGVYAAWAELDGRAHAAAVSVGKSETFSMEEWRVEAFLLDFDAEIYNEPMRLAFVRKLRDNCRFGSVEGLKEQLHRDVAAVREILQSDRDVPNPMK